MCALFHRYKTQEFMEDKALFAHLNYPNVRNSASFKISITRKLNVNELVTFSELYHNGKHNTNKY